MLPSNSSLSLPLLFVVLACAGSDDNGGNSGAEGDGDLAATGGMPPATGGLGVTGGNGGGPGTGGASDGTGGTTGGSETGGTGTGGTGTGTGGGDEAPCAGLPPLELGAGLRCGDASHIFRDSGPHQNRVNYVILGDGYTEELLDTLYISHIENMLSHEQGLFGQLSEPYATYQNFINICALRVVSADACIDDLDTGLECDTALGGYGDDASRLGIVDSGSVRDKVAEMIPPEVDVDWTGVTINAGADNWWNSGGAIMVWNGGFEPASHSASVALHEGGHSFHGLADEYDGTSTNCGTANEANVSTESSGSKWAEWLGFDHKPGTGLHGSYEGARYCTTGVYRPTDNSEMNQLPDYFNMPSMQKMVHDFYAIVRPVDVHTENEELLVDPAALQVRVVDPAVLTIEWSVDGNVVEGEDSECFVTDGLSPGPHTITVRVFDETPWVRDSRDDLEQSISWDVTLE